MTNQYNTILNYPNDTGAMPLLYSIRDSIPLAFDGVLLCIFMILFAGNYFVIQNKTGRTKILIALLSSSFASMVLSLMLSLAKLTSFVSVILYAFLTIISFILLNISDNQ